MADNAKRGRGRPRKETAAKAKQVYVALPAPVIEAVDKEASAYMVTRSEFLRRVISDYFFQNKK